MSAPLRTETSEPGRVDNASLDALEAAVPSLQEWHRPTITRIDIKKTLFGTGSQADSISVTS